MESRSSPSVLPLSPETLDEVQSRELVAALRRMDLIGPDEVPPLVALTGGVSSLIVLARTTRGPVCVKRALAKLRVAADWFAPVERNRAEVAWMRIAESVKPGTVPAILGEDAYAMAFAMEWLAPTAYPMWKEQLRDGVVQSRTALRVGENLAAIHRATAGDPQIAHEFANDDSFYAIRLEPYLEASARAHPSHAVALRQLIDTTASTKRALIHGDVSPKNILVGPIGPVFLDAECACYGDPAFDLAFCLNHLLLKCVWRPALTAALLASFDALAENYLAGVDWEPSLDLERRTVQLLPGLMLARVDGKSPVEYLTQPMERERVRQFAVRHLEQPVSQLKTLRAHWAKNMHS
jgi:aminoglycoside phosphotransferase (APT) family kinase protein